MSLRLYMVKYKIVIFSGALPDPVDHILSLSDLDPGKSSVETAVAAAAAPASVGAENQAATATTADPGASEKEEMKLTCDKLRRERDEFR